ncbi:MAG: site-2 protease family protein [Nitrospirae bacterium]|nr:site-2 protease family protein [Nitrospirota bacterium]
MDFTQIIRETALLAVPLLIAVTFHEVAHGFVADKLGDPTARFAGRLTLNPLKHLDPIGTMVFIFTRMIGWAKPVPVNPYNLKNPRQDMMWVSIAGPGANFIIAIISAFLYKTLRTTLALPDEIYIPVVLMLRYCVVLNIGLGVFNLIPIPPLDGSKILMGLLSHKHAVAYSRIEPYGFIILLGLIFLGVTSYIIFPIVILLVYLLIGG